MRPDSFGLEVVAVRDHPGFPPGHDLTRLPATLPGGGPRHLWLAALDAKPSTVGQFGATVVTVHVSDLLRVSRDLGPDAVYHENG